MLYLGAFMDQRVSIMHYATSLMALRHYVWSLYINSLEYRGNYSATSNNMKLVHWPLICGLLHSVAGPMIPPKKVEATSPPRGVNFLPSLPLEVGPLKSS